jgi:hypothetical protein
MIMSKWNQLVGACALSAALAGGPAAEAAQEATVLLRSGERVTGTFEDIANGQVYLRVSQHDQRKLPVDQIAVIDFVGGTRGLPESELAEARRGGDLLLLQGGSSFRGKLEDVVGARDLATPDAPLEIVFRDSEGRVQRVDSHRVARLYLGAVPDLSGVPGAVATTGTTPPAPAAETPKSTTFGPGQAGWVDARTPWTPTGIHVREGDLVSFTAQGEVKIGENHIAGPAGSSRQQYSGTAPMPQDLMGALIGRVDGSEAFGIGDLTKPLRMPATGQLYLGINATPGDMQSFEGGFSVTVTHTPGARRGR